ncbi:hypothetical protein Nepgr_002479 [Nepenthes gracilis]|uniref:VASt domain-containing protein n=1 Tax=Nepenthes gracilis TaxID=150966 RepID=A0AAD3P7X9_NEPGR|nr:hypothetical protein Nepgr_002479 [Nepenthes gracilis]
MAVSLVCPEREVPTSQSMESPSPKRPSETTSSSSSPDRSDRLNRSISVSRDADIQSSMSSRSEEYRQLFRLPAEEVLIQDFNCALQESILLQGHMYLFDRYVCFYSNIFGFETKKIIPFNEVSFVRRAKTAGIFPNAIEIAAGGRKHFFASFLSRDEAFKLIADRWSQYGDGAEGIVGQEDAKAETISDLNGVIALEEVDNSELQARELDCGERKMAANVSGDMKRPPNIEDGYMRTVPVEVQDIREESGKVVVDVQVSTSESDFHWKEEALDSPEIPNSYTKVAESKYPINVEEFFNLFFSDAADDFIESFHRSCGDKGFKCTKWFPHDKFGRTRELSFLHPIKIYFGSKYGGCKEVLRYQVYRNSHLVIKTLQEVKDVPYADYFQVEGLWDVKRESGQSRESCILRIYVNVAFSKKTMWKGKIEQSTIEECREAYATWIDLAHDVLKQKNIEKIEESAAANIPQNGQTCPVNPQRIEEPSRNWLQNNEPARVLDKIPDFMDYSQQIGNSLQKILFYTCKVASVSRALMVKFSSFLRSQRDIQVLLVVVFAIILLFMQLSIVVLLSRPQQIHVLPQADHVTVMGLGGSQRAAESIAWLEKRTHLLKDEMLVVEAQLERMRHELMLLKAQLNKQR